MELLGMEDFVIGFGVMMPSATAAADRRLEVPGT